jgi:type I restriction enzyme S subunit
MQTVPLGELGEIVSGSTPKTNTPQFWDGDIPWVTPADLSNHEGIYFQGKHKKITRAGFESCSTTMLPAGSILFSSRAPIGHSAVTSYPVCTNQGFKNIIPNKRLDPIYGFFVLKFLTPDIIAKGRGATFAEVNKEIVEEVEIPYCDLREQRRIAGELERADGLRRKRRYALELADTFLPAAFLQLFGDLIRNERKWDFRGLEETADIASGIAKGQKYGSRQTCEVPYLRVANVQDGYLNLTEVKTIQALLEDVEHLRLQKSDIVMTEGGDFDKLGRGAIWPGGIKDCIHQNHIFRVRLDQSKLLPDFFAAFLRSPCAKNYFLRCSKQTTNLASINMTQLRGTPTPVPPLSLQKRFAELVSRHERLRSVQRESLRQADHLFQSLLDRAFNGGS